MISGNQKTSAEHTTVTTQGLPALDTGTGVELNTLPAGLTTLRAYKENPSTENRDAAVASYFYLVQYQAEKLAARLPVQANVDADDLCQEGYFGLIDAMDAFDFERGVKFETYAPVRINGAMLDSLRRQDWVPRLVRQQESSVKKTIQQLTDQLGHEPDDSQCAAALNITREEYLARKREANVVRTKRLSTLIPHNDAAKPTEFGDTIENIGSTNPLRELLNKELSQEVLKGLNATERDIFHLYIVEEKPMNEIGLILDLSESRVSQMFTGIVERLQNRLLDGAKRNDTSFISELAREIIPASALENTEFLPLPDSIINALDSANKAHGMQFIFVEENTEYSADEASENFVKKLVAKARQKLEQDAMDDSSSITQHDSTDNTQNTADTDTDTDFGFTFF